MLGLAGKLANVITEPAQRQQDLGLPSEVESHPPRNSVQAGLDASAKPIGAGGLTPLPRPRSADYQLPNGTETVESPHQRHEEVLERWAEAMLQRNANTLSTFWTRRHSHQAGVHRCFRPTKIPLGLLTKVPFRTLTKPGANLLKATIPDPLF